MSRSFALSREHARRRRGLVLARRTGDLERSAAR